MTRQEQIEFVRELSQNVANSIIAQIEQERVPAEWDGKELRLLLAEKHSDWSFMNTPALKRRFRNTVATRGL